MNRRAGGRGRRRRAAIGACGLALAAALALGGCATTRLATEWSDPAVAPAGGYRTWLVMAAMPDPVRRRQWEDRFASALAERGVSVTPSHRLFPESFPDSAEARAKLREGGFDGLLVLRKGAEDEQPRGGRPGGASVGVGGSFVPFWGVYVSVFHRMGRGAAPVLERVVRYDAEAWDAGGRLVWAGRTGMIPPGDAEATARALAPAVVPRLRQAGLLR